MNSISNYCSAHHKVGSFLLLMIHKVKFIMWEDGHDN